jgi:hypothetical protein
MYQKHRTGRNLSRRTTNHNNKEGVEQEALCKSGQVHVQVLKVEAFMPGITGNRTFQDFKK